MSHDLEMRQQSRDVSAKLRHVSFLENAHERSQDPKSAHVRYLTIAHVS